MKKVLAAATLLGVAVAVYIGWAIKTMDPPTPKWNWKQQRGETY